MGGWGDGGGFQDLFNSMIYDLKRSVVLRLLFDPVLHSSLDDLVKLKHPQFFAKNVAIYTFFLGKIEKFACKT